MLSALASVLGLAVGCANQRAAITKPPGHAATQQVPATPGQVRVQTVTPREGAVAPNYASATAPSANTGMANTAPLSMPQQPSLGTPTSNSLAAMSSGQQPASANGTSADQAAGSNGQVPVQPVSRSTVATSPQMPTAAPLANGSPGQASQDSATNLAQTRQIVDRALAFYLQFPAYTCKMTRQESVKGKEQPAEILMMKFRAQPRSVFYEWVDDKNKGRECVYVAGQNNGQMITRGGKSDFLFKGRQIRLDPNGTLAKAKSRYSIAESGMDNMVRRLEVRVANLQRGDMSTGRIVYLGQVKRDESAVPLDYIRNDVPAGADPAFPEGGIRHWYFDPRDGRMVVMTATTPSGEFLEYYHVDQFAPAKLSDADFDPEQIWPSRSSAIGPSWGMSDPLADASDFLPK